MSTLGNQKNQENWTNLPLYQVLYEWIIKNMSIPNDISTVVAYIALFLITWYSVVWLTRFLFTIIWPLFLIGSGIAVFRILQYYEPDDIADIFSKSVSVVVDTLVSARFFYKYTLHQSVRIYKNIQDCILVFYYYVFGIKQSEEQIKEETLDEIFDGEEILHIN